MVVRRLFILVPSLHPTGPVKGAVALANALADRRPVTLVALKPGTGVDASLDTRVEVIELSHSGGLLQRLRTYQALLESAGGRKGIASISFCFSADMVNLLCRKHAVTCTSVRGNLLRNYRMDYGLMGYPLAAVHLVLLRMMDHVVAMTDAMAQQVAKYLGQRPRVIPNFVDESPLDVYRREKVSQGPFKFVFLGSLTRRKQPQLLIEAMLGLREMGHEAHLHVIGAGPLMDDLRERIQRLNLGDCISLHGHLVEPYSLLAYADALVLPSLSEGISRASLEALYLGIPCVMRAADGNAELIHTGENGVLFEHDAELPAAMLRAAKLARSRPGKPMPLLPEHFRQSSAATEYLQLVNGDL